MGPFTVRPVTTFSVLRDGQVPVPVGLGPPALLRLGRGCGRRPRLPRSRCLSRPRTEPGAQLANMASNAVTPWREAPYPVLVGTATTGAGVSPPTRLANAPSIPAMTTTASADMSRSVCSSSRWTPATPQSVTSTGSKPSARKRGGALLGHGQVGRPGGENCYLLRPGRRRAPKNSRPGLLTSRVSGQDCGGLFCIGPAQDHRPPVGLGQQLAHDGDAVLDGFARAVDRLGEPLAQRPVVVDAGETQVGVGQAPQPAHDLVSADRPVLEVTEQAVEGSFVHTCPMLPRFWGLALCACVRRPGPRSAPLGRRRLVSLRASEASAS